MQRYRTVILITILALCTIAYAQNNINQNEVNRLWLQRNISMIRRAIILGVVSQNQSIVYTTNPKVKELITELEKSARFKLGSGGFQLAKEPLPKGVRFNSIPDGGLFQIKGDWHGLYGSLPRVEFKDGQVGIKNGKVFVSNGTQVKISDEVYSYKNEEWQSINGSSPERVYDNSDIHF